MRTNCYFLTDEDTGETIVADPADECEKIISKLNERNLKLKFILLTHAHFDHMLALEELRGKTAAPLMIHKNDAPALLDPKLSLMSRFAGIDTPCKDAEIKLGDNDIIKLGNNEIRVMHTPGHTPGSICLVFDRTIISGDTIFRENIGRHDFPGGNYAQLEESLKKLSSLEGDYKIYSGHGASTTLAHEREFNPYLS